MTDTYCFVAFFVLAAIVAFWYANQSAVKAALLTQKDEFLEKQAYEATLALVSKYLDPTDSIHHSEWFKQEAHKPGAHLTILRQIIEEKVRKLATLYGTSNVEKKNLNECIEILHATGSLSTEEAASLHKSRQVCNIAVHKGKLEKAKIDATLGEAESIISMLNEKIIGHSP